MHQYLITVISAAVLSAVAQAISPENWKKYLYVITGIMIISVIAAPVFEFRDIDLFGDFGYNDNLDMYAQKKAVIAELEKRVSFDAENRLTNEFGGEFKVTTKLMVNKNYEIESVREMNVWTNQKKAQVKEYIQKVYSPQKILFSN